MQNAGRKNVLGVWVDAVDEEAAIERILAAARARQPFACAAAPVHTLMTGVLDARQRYRLNHLDLVTPDGQPVRWALNLLHHTRLKRRVYGPDLMLHLCQRAADEGLGVYLYGSRPEVLGQLIINLRQRCPGICISGSFSPPFRALEPAEDVQAVEQIRASGASLVFVGLGCPKQERWAYEHRNAIALPVVCVGAAFDFYAGTLPQAPRWMQDRGLEWLFRLTREPARLWRRYLLLNPLYLVLLFLQWVKIWRPDPNSAPEPSANEMG